MRALALASLLLLLGSCQGVSCTPGAAAHRDPRDRHLDGGSLSVSCRY